MTEEKLNKIEEQIKSEQQSISYDIKDFTIEYYVQKYLTNEDTEENEYLESPVFINAVEEPPGPPAHKRCQNMCGNEDRHA